MKAAVYYETGAPDVLRYEDVADPTIGAGDVLVQVAAVSIEGGDHPEPPRWRRWPRRRTSWATSAPGRSCRSASR